MVRRNFSERKRRGKQDSLTVSFGEHATVAGRNKISNLLSRHRGLHVIENSNSMTKAEAAEELRALGKIARENRWGEVISNARSKREKIKLEDIARFYKEKRGKIAFAEVFPKRETLKMKRLLGIGEKILHATDLAAEQGKTEILLELVNSFLNNRAEIDRMRNAAMVKKIGTKKGNVLARLGTMHDLIFPELRKSRPEAKVISGGRTIFSNFEVLLRLKILGNAANPPKILLARAYLGALTTKTRLGLIRTLRVSVENPKIELFFRGLVDSLPEKNLIGIMAQNPGTKPKDWLTLQLFAQNNLPQDFLKLKPNEQFAIMREFCKRVYGRNSILYLTAYPPKPKEY